mmetsp:Transcript_78912/g.203254  ORF Transcript_78912/g.203254 Transcript_78912/m.203254 type:complete len:478 (+) Transcript_78912:699-2132(+)
MPVCQSLMAPAAATSPLARKVPIWSRSRCRAFFTRLRTALGSWMPAGGRSPRGQIGPTLCTSAMARSTSSSFSAPSAFSVCRAQLRASSASAALCSSACSASSATASSRPSLSRRSAENSCCTRSVSISAFLARASCLSFSACSRARCLASSRCCSFLTSSASAFFRACSPWRLAFSSSFFSCWRFLASACACSLRFSSSRFFFSSAFSASRFARSTSRAASSSRFFFSFSARTLAAFAAASFLRCSSSGSSSSEDWPLEVLSVSSSALTAVTAVRPRDSMAAWKRAAAFSALFFSAFWTSSPSFRSCASSNCRHTSLSWSRSTNCLTDSWKPRSRWRHFFSSFLTASRSAFSLALRSFSFCLSASSASRRTRSSSSFFRCAAFCSSFLRAMSASRAARLASFSAAMRGSYFSERRTSSEMRSRSACRYFLAMRSFSRIIQRFSSRHSASARSMSSSPSFCARMIGSRQEEKPYQNS